MPATQILHANELTQKKWSETVFKYELANMPLAKFFGFAGKEDAANSPIVVNQDLSKNTPGDQVIFELDVALTGAGGHDDSDIENNEESMSFFNMPVVVHERSHGVRSAGKMTDKRSAVDVLKKGFYALARWSSEQLENDLTWAVCGLGNQGGYVGEGATDIATINEQAPSTNRVLYGGQTAAGVASWVATDNAIQGTVTNYLFGTKVIEKMKMKAILASPKFRPVMIGGKAYYILLIHPLQLAALEAETGTIGWASIQQNANVRGINNPLFGREGSGEDRMWNGAVGVWKDVIIYTSERLPTRVAGECFHSNADTIHANIVSGTYRLARCVLMGAQAITLAWGQMWQRHIKDFDYDRKPGVAMDGIYGVKKTVFRDPGALQAANDSQEDYATIVCDTAVEEA